MTSSLALRSLTVSAALALTGVVAGCGSSGTAKVAATTVAPATSSTVAPTSTSAASSTTTLPATTTTLPPTPDTRTTASGHDFAGLTPVDPGDYLTAGLGVFFSSPSGKFICGILAAVPNSGQTGLAGCQGTTKPVPPRPATCVDLDWGGGMQVDLSGSVSFLCTGGVVFGNGIGPGKVLPYGSTLTASGFVCTTATNGVSCMEKATGHGFTIAADSNETY